MVEYALLLRKGERTYISQPNSASNSLFSRKGERTDVEFRVVGIVSVAAVFHFLTAFLHVP